MGGNGQAMAPQLEELTRQIDTGERLQLIATRIGLALWSFQNIESCSALCFAMIAKATKGMGLEAGYALLRDAESKPFGAIVDGLRKAALLTPDVEARLEKLRVERNWLVHRSLAESRGAVHSDRAMEQLVARIEAINNECSALLRVIQTLATRHAERAGVSREEIDQQAQRTLAEWRGDEG